MRHILVKEGARQPSVFSDFVETVNREEAAQVGFFTRMDPGLRLIRNRTRDDRNCAFAIAHYQVDPTLHVQPKTHFLPIDTQLLTDNADAYDYVMVGVVTPNHIVHDFKALVQAQYIARDSEGNLIDIKTKERVHLDGSVTFFTAFFGFVRVKGFNAYYMILNPNLVHVTDGFDFYETPTDTLWTLVSDHDGNLREAIFRPGVLSGRIIGDTILTDEPTFEFSVLSSKGGVMMRESAVDILAGAEYTVETNLNYHEQDGSFHVSSPKAGKVGFFELHFHCGAFFEVAGDHESPTFKYVVHRYGK